MKKVNGTKDSTPEFNKVQIKLPSGLPLPKRLYCRNKDDSIVVKDIGDCTLTEIFDAPVVIQALIHQLSGERVQAIELRESIFKISQETPKTSH
ncbi:MAG: hypothetical protein ACO3CJ_09750 [Burkholderiaceae bacterium]